MTRTLTSTLWHNKRVWLLQFLLNAFLLLAFWLWLSVPETHAWEVALSFVLAALIVWMEFWLQSATLAHFQEPPATTLRDSFRRSGSRVLPFAVWIIVGAALCRLALRAESNSGQLGGWLRHAMPAFLRSHISPYHAASALGVVLGVIGWIVIPVLWLPVAARISHKSSADAQPSVDSRAIPRWKWCLSYLVLFTIGVYVPYKLVNWIPEATGLRRQAMSMGLRFAAAYGLMITSWWIMAAVLGRRSSESDGDEMIEVREPALASPPGRKFGAEAEL